MEGRYESYTEQTRKYCLGVHPTRLVHRGDVDLLLDFVLSVRGLLCKLKKGLKMLTIKTKVYFDGIAGSVMLPRDYDLWRDDIKNSLPDRDFVLSVCVSPRKIKAVISLVSDDSDDATNCLEICLDRKTVTEFITALTIVRDNLKDVKSSHLELPHDNTSIGE